MDDNDATLQENNSDMESDVTVLNDVGKISLLIGPPLFSVVGLRDTRGAIIGTVTNIKKEKLEDSAEQEAGDSVLGNDTAAILAVNGTATFTLDVDKKKSADKTVNGTATVTLDADKKSQQTRQ